MNDRYGRQVRRARLSASPHAPARKLTFTIEEALRLASLPGENEGRTYYFRYLRISGLPADGDRRVWLEAFQRALIERASDAVHGSDPRAAEAPAVFFRGEQEALELLLHRVLARRGTDEWFWPAVLRQGRTAAAPAAPVSAATGARLIVQIVEMLRERPASWVAVAAALFARDVDGAVDVARLLHAIPSAIARAWLAELDVRPSLSGAVARSISARAPRPGDGPQAAHVTAFAAAVPSTDAKIDARFLALPPHIRRSLERVVAIFGADDARVVWLTAIAILSERPSELALGTAASIARPLLTALESARLPLSDTAPVQAGAPVALAVTPSAADGGTAPEPPSSPAEDVQSAPEPLSSTSPRPWQFAGARTSAGGLFFLLNALRRLGIENALAAGLFRSAPWLQAQVLRLLAVEAGVAEDDPVRLWLESLIPAELPAPVDACPASWRPGNLPLKKAVTRDSLVRAWALAVRRWIMRAPAQPRLRLTDVVIREGLFAVNRTDLDVSLPLDAADVRIRRIGLDLDPGWLPWFGRVVRFHYLYRGEFYG